MPLKSSTVAGLTWKRIGTSTVEPNIAKRCCRESGIVWRSGSRSSGAMVLCVMKMLLWKIVIPKKNLAQNERFV